MTTKGRLTPFSKPTGVILTLVLTTSVTARVAAQEVATSGQAKAPAGPATAPGGEECLHKPATSAAQCPCSEPRQGGEYRFLGGHTFITPAVVHTAFTNTSFAFAQGFGVLNYKGQNIRTNQSQKARLFLYGQDFFGQFGILNRVSLDWSAAGFAAVGGDLDAILTQGAIADLRVGAMPKVRMVTFKRAGLQLSAGFGFSYERAFQVSPKQIAQAAVQQQDVPKDDILTQAEAFSLSPTFMIAEG